MIKYPQTRQEQIVDDFFGVKVADPYRWLEDDNSEETIQWVKEQQALTEKVLNEYPDRGRLLERLKELNDFPKQGPYMKRGDWYYFAKNDGLQNQWVIYRKPTLDGEEELFLDPNLLSEDGTTSVDRVGKSKDNRYFVYQISTAGSDAGEFWILDTNTKEWLDDKLFNMRHSGASWYKNGYFYSRYDSEENYQEQNKNQKVYYHKIGDKQEADTLVYEDPEHPLRYIGAWVSDDERYLFIQLSEGTSGESIIYKSLEDEKAEFKCLFEGFEFNCSAFDAFEPDMVYLHTNKGAKNYRLLKADLKSPDSHIEIIPERDYLLESVSILGHKIITIYTKDVKSQIEVYDLEGKFLYCIDMPYQGTAYFLHAEKEDTEGFFYFSSYVRPPEQYHYDVDKNVLRFHYHDPIKAELQYLISEQLFFPSKDGSKIPMTIIYNKGMKKNGNNPVYLYAYGGFNVPLMPWFDVNNLLFLERGGISVVVNLRGGSEYGENWHEAGMLLNKQNVFDDFISSAEYLIREGYTNPEKIAIIGASNGGLLVGACMLQRPDLFKVAIPRVGVLDMLRYHKFTAGWGWMVEYGNPDEEEHFHNLYKYSPLHNVQKDVQYPATMIVTADHDDRVIPGHSFKFAAALQEKAKQELPLILYTQIQSSHGGSSMTKGLELNADVFCFICKYLGM